jgi:hypothetical protein
MKLLNGQGDDKLDLFLLICRVYYNFSSIWLFIALNSLVYVPLLHKPLIYFQFLTTTSNIMQYDTSCYYFLWLYANLITIVITIKVPL